MNASPMFARLRAAAAVAAVLPLALAAQVPNSQAQHVVRIESSLRPGPIVSGNQTTIDARMRALHVPAVSIAVVDSGRIIWAKAYGVADVETNRAATTLTRFQAASMSKPVASMGALRLVQDGKLALDTDVNSLLRSWKLPANALTATTPVTLRMLLTHTAGTTVHGFPGYPFGSPNSRCRTALFRSPRGGTSPTAPRCRHTGTRILK